MLENFPTGSGITRVQVMGEVYLDANPVRDLRERVPAAMGFGLTEGALVVAVPVTMLIVSTTVAATAFASSLLHPEQRPRVGVNSNGHNHAHPQV